MEKLVLCWFVLLTLLSFSRSATAQDTFPVGAVIGVVFGVLGVCISFAIPIGIWICIFCGAAYASKRQNQRPVNSFVVQSGATPHPPPGSYPTQTQTTNTTSAYPSAYPAYPQQPSDAAYPQQPSDAAYPQQPSDAAYPPSNPSQQPSAPYPSAPGYPDAPPPYAPPTDSKQPF